MDITFDKDNGIGGIMLAFTKPDSAGARCPMLIAGIQQTDAEFAAKAPQRYTVASMQDGFSFYAGTSEEVVEWIRSKSNLIIVPKMIFKGLIGTLPENRASLPIVAIACSGAA